MKNHSKFLLLVLGTSLVVAPLLRAQDAPQPDRDPGRVERPEKLRQHAKERREHLAEELGLNADQKAKIKEINQQEKAALQAVRADASLSKEEKRAKAREINQGFAGQRDTVFTPEQKVKADQLRAKARERRAEWREKRHERHDRRHGGDDTP